MKTEKALGVVASVNRPLAEFERQSQLDIKQNTGFEPFDQVCNIRVNSVFLEMVDVYHAWRGALSSFSLFWLSFLSWFLFEEFVYTFDNYSRIKNLGCFGGLIVFGFIPIMFFLVWMLRFDAFRLTHCSIRLNRKNRTVYMFRRNGTVASVPWEKAFFLVWSDSSHRGLLGLQCHILDESRQTVLDTFTFDYQGDREGVLQLWEYIRTYMEKGPDKVKAGTSFCLPIGDRKEPPWFGLVRLLMNFNGWPLFQVLISPLVFVFAIGRAIATLTCRIPKWPKEVEEACAIPPGDPYARDWRNNPPLDWWIFFGKQQAD